MHNQKIVIPGGAGLVGHNLVIQLKERGFQNLHVLDKHKNNLHILKKIHPTVVTECADLAERGEWERHFKDASCVVMLQAQIGGSKPEPFIRNNISSTRLIIAAIKKYKVPYTVHTSSSVVNSILKDHYVRTKRNQEIQIIESKINSVVLRPTLMFGWFDRKHLGWLSRIMQKIPFFPVPGTGEYTRQPLFVGDFCNIIIKCIESRLSGKIFNISGLEKINYIDIIRQIKYVLGCHCWIKPIPYSIFYLLLKTWALFDRNPPFTVDQLIALTASEKFEVIDWPAIFNVEATPFSDAVKKTFNHPYYSRVHLEF